ARFAGQLDPRLSPETEPRDVLEEFLLADFHRHSDRAAVRRFRKGVFGRQITVSVRVTYHTLANGDLTAAAIDHIVRFYHAFLEGRRVGDHFEDRAGFIGPTDRAVLTRLVVVGNGTFVRVEGRDVGEGEDGACLRLNHDRARAFRVCHPHSL